jgi:hypothetical protein
VIKKGDIEFKMFTVGDLKKIINDIPDDALVLQDDPFSEFSYDIKGVGCGRTIIDHITKKGEKFYSTWDNNCFNESLEDNLDQKEQIEKEYMLALIIYLE